MFTDKDHEMLNEIAQIIPQQQQDLPTKPSHKILAKLLPTLSIILSEESKSAKIIKRLYEKISQSVDSEDVRHFSEYLIQSESKNETCLTLAILLSKDKLTQEDYILQYVKLILAATKRLPIKGGSKNEEGHEGHKILMIAHEMKAIPITAMKVAIQALCAKSDPDQFQSLLVAMIGGVWHLKDPDLVQPITDFLQNQPEFSAALLAYHTLDIFVPLGGDPEDEPTVTKHMHLLALQALLDTFDNSQEMKKIMSFESQVIPGLVAGLLSASKKVRKKAIKCCQKALENPVTRSNYAPLLKFLVAHKEAILANPNNLADTMKSFQDENRAYNSVMTALVDTALATNELLIALSKMFKYLESKNLIDIGKY